jgi:hypothetical protein
LKGGQLGIGIRTKVNGGVLAIGLVLGCFGGVVVVMIAVCWWL